MTTHRLPQSVVREAAREITLAVAMLTDSVTLTTYAKANAARLRIRQLPDGRCLFALIADRVAITPEFTDAHALLAHLCMETEVVA